MTEEDRELLRRIIQRHQPSLLSVFDTLDNADLPEEIREEIAEALVDELFDNGLKEDHEPNEYGLKVDDLIGLIMDY